MTDIAELEASILADIDAASDEATIEAVRVSMPVSCQQSHW